VNFQYSYQHKNIQLTKVSFLCEKKIPQIIWFYYSGSCTAFFSVVLLNN